MIVIANNPEQTTLAIICGVTLSRQVSISQSRFCVGNSGGDR